MSPQSLIAGIPLTIVIVTLVEIIKRAGMPRRFASLAAVALGVGISLLAHVVHVLPWLREWSDTAATGVLLGLAACGVYSSSKAMVVRNARGRFRVLGEGDVIAGRARPAGEVPPSGRWE